MIERFDDHTTVTNTAEPGANEEKAIVRLKVLHGHPATREHRGEHDEHLRATIVGDDARDRPAVARAMDA